MELVQAETGQPNPALQFLNAQIERDLESQKANLSNKHNLLSALQQQYGATVHADNMYRAIRSQDLANQIGMAAAKSQGALGSAASQLAQSQFTQQAAQYARQIALAGMQANVQNPAQQQTGLDAKASQYLQAARILDPKQAEEFEKRYIPGVGVANVPLEPKDRELLQKKTELKDLFGRAQDYLGQVGTTGPTILRPALRAQGQSLQNQLQLKMGELADLTRFTPEENKIYRQTVPDLTGTHLTGKDANLLKGLADTNDDTLNTFYKQKGINQQASSNPIVKGADGRMYRKSPDGTRMIVVK